MGCGVSNGSGPKDGDNLQSELSALRSKVAKLEAELRVLQSSLGAGAAGPAAGQRSSGAIGTPGPSLRVSAPARQPSAGPGAGTGLSIPAPDQRPEASQMGSEQAVTKEAVEARPSGGPSGGGDEHCLDLDAVRKLWPEVLREVRAKRIATYALLLEAKPFEFCDSTLILHFGPKAAFHRGEMDKEANSSLLHDALRKVLGFLPEVECIVGEGAAEAAPADTREDRALEGEALVAAIKERFSAQIVD